MEARRKPVRVATETRLDVRVTLDPHMGAIYHRLAAVPGRLRGRELLALARLAVGQAETGILNRATPMPAAPPQEATGTARSSVEAVAGLEHLEGFADATPPLH